MSSPEEILQEKRRKERMYNKTSYERHKLERRHKKLAEYYEKKGTTPKKESRLFSYIKDDG
jgi:hypothetical protein